MDKDMLAYSGGLDTSFAIRRLHERTNADVSRVTANLGNERDFELIQQDVMAVEA